MPRLIHTKFSVEHDDWLIEHSGGLPGDPDYWPYRDDFEALLALFFSAFGLFRKGDVWRRIIHVRKDRHITSATSKRLPYFPTRSYGRVLGKVWRLFLDQLYVVENTTLERLAYTSKFERIYDRAVFASADMGETKEFTRHDVWRTYLAMRKGGGKNGFTKLTRLVRR